MEWFVIACVGVLLYLAWVAVLVAEAAEDEHQ